MALEQCRPSDSSPPADDTKANRRDRPPVIRVLVLLVALVSTALALAALSPARPDAAALAVEPSGDKPAATSPSR